MWASEGLVVLGRVDGQGADELAGGGVDDAYVEVVGEHDDFCAAVFAAEADVVHAAVDSQGDASAVEAMVDRLVHHVEVIVLQGDSYRLKDRTNEVIAQKRSR